MTIAVLGEALIDFISDNDGAFRPHLGGSPFNVAIALARQGEPVSYLSPFSDDAFGEALRQALVAETVALPNERRSRWPTSLALVTLDDRGVPAYRLYREGVADKDTTFEEIAGLLPEDLVVFHTGSLAITPSQLPKVRRLFEMLRERGVVISLDINIRLGASIDTEAYLAGVRSLLPLADIVKASDEDLSPFQWASDPREAASKAFEEMDSGMLVLTLGEGGTQIHTAAGRLERKAWPVAQLVDTVGAGDTFHAALLAALRRNGAISGPYEAIDPGLLTEAMDFACAAAAINVSRAGCSPPTHEEVKTTLLGRQ